MELLKLINVFAPALPQMPKLPTPPNADHHAQPYRNGAGAANDAQPHAATIDLPVCVKLVFLIR